MNSIPSPKMATRLLAGLLAMLVDASHGATFTVNIVEYSFSPSSLTIKVGDTVTWSGLNNEHNVTGSAAQDLDEFCGSSLQSVGTETSCSRTFTTAGTFPYECTIHASFGMTGSLTVVAAAPTPTVSITKPASGAVFSAPASLEIQSTTSVSNGRVTNVTFFAGTTLLGSAQATPFQIAVSNLAAGSYSFTAVATAGGVSVTSSVVNVSVVLPVTVSNSAPGVANGRFSFDYGANIGLTYLVQESFDLVNWSPISTNVASGNPVNFRDTAPLGRWGYYRVGRLPNP
jgi:plastocyanin